MKSAKASTAVVLWETRAAHKQTPDEVMKWRRQDETLLNTTNFSEAGFSEAPSFASKSKNLSSNEDEVMKWRRQDESLLNATNISEAGFGEDPSFSSKPNNLSLNEDKKAALRLSNISEAEEQPDLRVFSPTGVDDFEAERVTASTKFQCSDALASSFESDFTRLFDDEEFTLTDKEETGKERKASNASLLEQHLAYLSNTIKGEKMQIKLNPSQMVHSPLATPTKKQEVDPTTSNSLDVSFSSQAYGPLMSCVTKDGMFAISCHQNAAVGVRSILQGFMPRIGTLADAVSEGYDMLASEFPEYLKPKSDVTDDA